MECPIITSATEWTQSVVNESFSFRFWNGKLFRREEGKGFYGGYQIKKVDHPSRLSNEWINEHFKAQVAVMDQCECESILQEWEHNPEGLLC